MTTCGNCGADIPPGRTACGVCGAPVEAGATPANPPPRPPEATRPAGGFRLSVRPAPRGGAALAAQRSSPRRDDPAPSTAPVVPEPAAVRPATGFVLVGEGTAGPSTPPSSVPAPASAPPPAAATPRSRFEELGFLFDKRRPPTIALVGMSTVGKTFFLARLEHIAREEGMTLRQRTRTGSIDFAVGARRPWEKDIQGTGETVVYSLGRSGKRSRDSLWIIDMRGEVFRDALKNHFRDSRVEEVRDFWMILAAAQAFVLMTPAAEALQLVDSDEDALWDLSLGLEPMSAAIHLLETKIAETGSLAAAVEAMATLDPHALAEDLDGPRERCRKPVLMLLTQADVMLQAARARFGEDGELDSDPMRVAAWRSRGLFMQLLGWFDHFKIDFVTACDGHDRSMKIMDVRRTSYGVWEAVTWARRMARRSARPATARFWRTRYAVLYRRMIDANFRDALSKR